jgi:uncharacterized NAD-dependent epimerase/dehydratase family protein
MSVPVRMMVMTEGRLGVFDAKTGVSVIRWCPGEVACVLDSTRAGQDLASIIGCGAGIPIVKSVREGIALGANTLLIGIAPGGGRLPGPWMPVLRESLERGIDILNGLHLFMNDVPELAAIAAGSGAVITDLRRPPEDIPCAKNLAKKEKVRRVLAVGSDCNSGKMTACLALHKSALARGINAGFVATGQTGMVIARSLAGGKRGAGKTWPIEWGIAIDRVISDFCAGASEMLVMAQKEKDVLFIEGQGSINHPAYSPVTLAQVHGSAPTDMVLCHHAGRDKTRSVDNPEPLPDLKRLLRTYEDLASYILPCRVRCVAINTVSISEDEARRTVERTEKELGLPASDPVRWGGDRLLDALGY